MASGTRSGRGKRRGSARRSEPAKKPHQPSDEPDNDMEAALSAAEKAGNTDRNFVDFEQLLQASGLNLSSKSRENLVPAPQGTNQPRNLFDKAFQSFSSAPGQNVEPLRCSGDEIFAHVPESLRKQILTGEYINLALLLKGGMELNEFCSGGSFKLSSDGGLEMKAKVCKEKIPSIEKWTDAFLIYASIYLTAQPNKALELLHYMFIIREAASRQRGYCWRDYDEQFRVRHTASSSWAVINNDLWWRCMQVRDSVAPTGDISGQTRSYTCNDFNSGVCRWPHPCRYPHVCSSCGSSQHGAMACSQLNSRSQQFANFPPFRGNPSGTSSRYPRSRGSRFPNTRGRGVRPRPF